ncbi:MAG: hypothetical protein JXA25_04120 [Anaerolineales bacterium]|nr:hypothetical protein [Anaerolineales bacterium]
MIPKPYRPIGTLNEQEEFADYLRQLDVILPFDTELKNGENSPLGKPYQLNEKTVIGNRFSTLPMEGSDGTREGKPTDLTFRRWERFGESGAKLIWGGEAVAVNPEGRSNPNQLLLNEENLPDFHRLREALTVRHLELFGTAEDLLVGLQLSHAGRFARPNAVDHPEPVLVHHHPDLDHIVNVEANWPLLSEKQIQGLQQDFIRAAVLAEKAGFDFVDIQHSSGTLGHEFLSAWDRGGVYGGTLENRARFLRGIVEGIRRETAGLRIGVRLSLFDLPPFSPDPETGIGVPVVLKHSRGAMFGGSPEDPLSVDLTEPFNLLEQVRQMGVRMINLTAGSRYYNTHVSCPAYYPPVGSYQPPEDPLVQVARQIEAAARVKQRFPDLLVVGSGYSYLQEWLPYVAQYNVQHGMTDFVGMGRALLSYPGMPAAILSGTKLDRQRICRTFSDCITAPELGLVSGCYPLDRHYMRHPDGKLLRLKKKELRSEARSK